MDKAQIVNLISERAGISKENVEKVLDTFEDVAKNELSSHLGNLGSLGNLGNLGKLTSILGLLNGNNTNNTNQTGTTNNDQGSNT